MLRIQHLLSLVFVLLSPFVLQAQSVLMDLIPINTATHTAQQSGDWFDTNTWTEGTIPSDAAIVHIPSGIEVSYEGQSDAHIFAIRVDGTFTCTQTSVNDTTSLTFDTFVGTMMSTIKFHADEATDGRIFVTIKPFHIENHKNGTLGYTQVWNTTATNYYADKATHYQVTYDIGPDKRFKTYANALSGDTDVTETSRIAVDDEEGILGRTAWDSTQLSIGLTTMGQLEIIGQEKTNMVKLSADAIKGTKDVQMESTPAGWVVGDSIVITAGGNKNPVSNATEPAEIGAISGGTITTVTNLKKNHLGRAADDLHCYVGNLTRNIVFRSATKDSTHRAHLMAMHNDMNVQIKNAAFIDMGRTSKSKLVDDRIWEQWVEPVVGNTYVSALGQECSQTMTPPKADISNHRGRYSLHLHKLGAAHMSNMAQVTGNVVWGNPGWAITHHDSHANVSDNVIYDVVGSALVSESGSETGFWDNNLITEVKKGHKTDDYIASLFYDEYLFSGQGMGMKGRAVICRGNVIADVNVGIGIVNFNATTVTDRMDAAALATVRPNYVFDQFPLSQHGYSKEGDGVIALEVALILENNIVIDCVYGLSSIERDMGVNHESRSVFHNLKIWGASTGVRITYQNDYSFRDLFISGRNDDAIGLYMWKHAHNHSFEGLKLVDLKEGITASKLVENETYTEAKTRNNGFTPWLFIDLETENVTELYGIHLDDESSPTTTYTEHPDNAIHLSSSQLSMTRPITFTLNENADLEIDLASAPADLKFTVDGVVTDRIGAYEFGVAQASSMQNLRFDYQERSYEFASQSALEDYLIANGVYEDPDNPGQLYFIIHEYVPDRISYEYKPFPIRVKILNPPSGAPYSSPLTESPAALEPANELISRFATATQSSDSNSEFFNGDKIYTLAGRAIDGNSNARINAKYYQYGLDSIGSSSITQTELEPWWEMDLGEEKIIEYIDIWNTVEMQGVNLETPSPTFKDFYVMISDTPLGNISLAAARTAAHTEFYKDNTLSRLFSADATNVKGRYIRIQAVGTTKLSIAEVDVIGRSISTKEDCEGNVGGLAYMDECGNCVGGNTGKEPCSLDANYVWGGTATTSTLTTSRLPVELIRFTAQLINDRSRLDWSTASEVNVHGFEVQRSKNLQDWEIIDFVNANNRASTYRIWDDFPFNGYTYYRLKIIDLDDTYEFSNIASVKRDIDSSISLFPNPSSQDVHVSFDVEENSTTEVSVIDFLGRIVHKETITSLLGGTSYVKLDAGKWPTGTYYFSIKDVVGKIKTVPFVIIRE